MDASSDIFLATNFTGLQKIWKSWNIDEVIAVKAVRAGQCGRLIDVQKIHAGCIGLPPYR